MDTALASTHYTLETGWPKNCTITAFLMYFQTVSPKMQFLYLFMNYRLNDFIILSYVAFKKIILTTNYNKGFYRASAAVC